MSLGVLEKWGNGIKKSQIHRRSIKILKFSELNLKFSELK